mmetsp:Transcript_9904/g.32872  ORF Transcript_9904/g.32872 Transcript_9904/m.32872 type:complete len:700 (+) Transcript_9904:88-2187(+)
MVPRSRAETRVHISQREDESLTLLAGGRRSRLCLAQLLEQPRVVKGELAEVAVAVCGGEVAGGEVHLEQHVVAVGHLGAQNLGPLCWLPIRHARVVESRDDERLWVDDALAHVVDGRVAAHVLVVLLLVRVAPLLPLLRRERDRRVAHRHHQVDERHARHRGAPELGRHVDHVAHQQAAGGAALAREPARLGDAPLEQRLAAVDKVGEGVSLREVLARRLVPPVVAHFAAAADVRDGVDDSAVNEGEARGGERGVHADAVAAVPVEVARRRPPLLDGVGAPEQRHGHRLAVARRHLDAAGLVEGGVVPRHRLLLERGVRVARPHVVLAQLPRRRHRRVLDPQPAGRLEEPVAPQLRREALVLEAEPVRARRGNPLPQRNHPQLREALLAAAHREEAAEGAHPVERAGGRVREDGRAIAAGDRRPVCRVVDRSRVELPVDEAVGVRGEEEGARWRVRVDVVPLAKLAPPDEGRVGGGRGGRHEEHLGRLLGLGLDEEQRGVARGPAVHVEELVRLLEDTHVFRLRRADDVPPHLKGPVLRVELHVEERALVRPRDAPSRPADLLLHLHAAAQLLEPHRVRLVPRPVHCVREQPARRARLHRVHVALARVPPALVLEVLQARHLVHVENRLLLAGAAARPAEVHPEGLALGGAAPVLVSVRGGRGVRVVVLLDVRKHLIVQRASETVEGGGFVLRVGVLVA